MSKPAKIKLTDRNWASLKYGLANVFVKSAFSNSVLNRKVEDYETIYHYTDFGGLIAILESQSFFCTNINFLNDTKEFNHGVEILENIIQSFQTDKSNERIFKLLQKDVNNIYSLNRHVTCFSKNGDLLSQWRSYGNKGKGIAIGFHPLDIEESIYEHTCGMNILYDKKVQTELIEEYIKIALKYFQDNKEIFDWTGYDYDFLVADTILNFLEDVIAGFKDPSFIEEKEFRIEYNGDDNINKAEKKTIHFRNSDNLIIPYITLNSKFKQRQLDAQKNPEVLKHTDTDIRLPLKEIILGPSLDYEMNKLGIEMLLKKIGYNDIKIKPSKIPYRI